MQILLLGNMSQGQVNDMRSQKGEKWIEINKKQNEDTVNTYNVSHAIGCLQ